MLITCKKATELIEYQQDEKLSFKDGFSLKVHLLMCKACNAYKKQSVKINKALSNFLTNGQTKSNKELEELKDRIKSKL